MAVSNKSRFRLFRGGITKHDSTRHQSSTTKHPVEAPNMILSNTFCPPRRLSELLIQKARDLQMLPEVAVKAIAIADDPNAKVTSLVTVIAQDVKLTSDILSLSNSSIFGSTQPILGLDQAITRVGFRQTKNMILASSITSMMQKMPWQEIRIRDLLCKHSFLTAVINSRLNSLFALGMQGEEFTAGLIHDIGRTLLAVTIPEEFETFDPLDIEEPLDLLVREQNAIGTNHAEVGAWFLQRNHIPEELITVARHHHSPQEADRFKRLVAVTAVADDMANFCQTCAPGAEFDVAENQNLEILCQLGVVDATNKLQEFASSLIDSAKQEVGQLLRA